MMSPINFNAKRTGEPTALNLHGGFDEAGAGNITKIKIFVNAPALDPTKDSLLGIILASLTKHEANQINDYTKKLFDCLSRCDVDSFIKTLQSFYGFIPNTIHISQEKYYQTIFYTILKLIGADIEVEISTNIGRIDAVVATQDYLYVIEFKLNKAPSIALEQIKQKKYFERYLDDKRVLILLGINFSSQEKNIVEYIVEELDHKV